MISVTLRPTCHLQLRRFICKSYTSSSPSPDRLDLYRESFAQRMAMAGIKPHHRIALGVSGGPDSTALCSLTAGWKADGLGFDRTRNEYIDGILGIIVDHRLRPESAEEADLVRNRVSKMGIKCVVECCYWSGCKPKLGHLQEAARDMRYQIFQSVCIAQQIGVLLIAHHADDQAELFILRLSRNSGVLGLAGMAFMSQLFPTSSHCCSEGYQGILLVRPILEFSKDDMYNICKGEHQDWVEDPTNQRPLFARNRLRISLKSKSSNVFRSEMQRLIAACRLTRTFVQNICHKMIEHCVTINHHGYAIVDLEKLAPSTVQDLCLSKFLAAILQFISQRHRPVRGSVSHLLLDYARTLPCKTSLTAAGCYLSPAPQSKGRKILVCSHDSPQSSRMTLSHIHPSHEQPHFPGEIDQIILNSKLYSDKSPLASTVHFLDANSSADVLNEAKNLDLISESTLLSMCSLQMEEHKNFIEGASSCESRQEKTFPNCSHINLHRGESCHFMSRFLVTWEVCRDASEEGCSCRYCMSGELGSIIIRHMVDADWLYLAKISNGHSIQDSQQNANVSKVTGEVLCSAYMQLSAKKALQALKSIPVSARRALPVVVNSHDLLLSIPSICFSCCPHLLATAMFKPRVPIGGGYSSYS